MQRCRLSNNNYITILTSSDNANKSYTLENDGSITKKSPSYKSNRTAVTWHIQDLNHLKSALDSIGDMSNAILILGWIKGTENGSPYQIISTKQLKELTNKDDVAGLHIDNNVTYAARLKSSFTQSSFFCFDRDEVAGMPSELIYPTHAEWWAAMQNWLPMLNGVGYLMSPSNSGRIKVDGQPYAKDNHHIYLQAKDNSDVERFGKAALIHSFSHDAGFMKEIHSSNTGEVTGHRPWTIFDPTTFSREREIYDGMPVVSGKGLTVEPSNVVFIPGDIVDTRRLIDPTRDQQKALGMDLVKTKSGNYQVHDHTSLSLDTIIDFKIQGSMTLREFAQLGIDRERCQSFVRPDSSSMAAYINKTNTGQWFMHDVGTGTNYYCKMTAQDMFGDVAGNVEAMSFIDCSKMDSTPLDVVATQEDSSKHKVEEIQEKKPEIIDIKELDDLHQELKRTTKGSDEKRELANKMCRLSEGLNADLKQHYHETVRFEMEWTKADFAIILKDYRKSWYQNSGQSQNDWLLSNIVLITENMGGFYNLSRGIFQTASSLNALYGDMNLGDVSPSMLIAESKNKKIADAIGWHPVDQETFKHGKRTLVNTYEKPYFTQVAGDISMWMELMEFIYGEHVNLVLDHMAFTLQFPHKKIRWQVLGTGRARTGKTLSVEPLLRILGDAAGTVHTDEMEGTWGDLWGRKKVLCFEEVMTQDKREFNRLKTKLSNSNLEKLNIKGKGMVEQRNLYSIYMFSNHADALRFEEDQQKLLVIATPDTKKTDSFYKELGELIDTDNYVNHCYHFLMTRDVSKFSYTKLPVQTEAEFEMIKASRPDYEIELLEMIEDGQGCLGDKAFKFDVLIEQLRVSGLRCTNKNIKRILNDKGIIKHKYRKRDNGVVKNGTYWAKKIEGSEGDNYAYLMTLSASVKLSIVM